MREVLLVLSCFFNVFSGGAPPECRHKQEIMQRLEDVVLKQNTIDSLRKEGTPLKQINELRYQLVIFEADSLFPTMEEIGSCRYPTTDSSFSAVIINYMLHRKSVSEFPIKFFTLYFLKNSESVLKAMHGLKHEEQKLIATILTEGNTEFIADSLADGSLIEKINGIINNK